MTDASLGTSPVVGILGGIGPAATADFYAKLIEETPAATDQEHLRVAIRVDPTIPDRSQAIADRGEDPTLKLAEGTQRLKDAGASFYVVVNRLVERGADVIIAGCTEIPLAISEEESPPSTHHRPSESAGKPCGD